MDHYNKHQKQDVWEDVAQDIETLVDVCKKKVNDAVILRKNDT